jgi:hypothetical protein
VNAFARRCVEAGVAACFGILGGLSITWLRPHGPRSPEVPPSTPSLDPEIPMPERSEEAFAALRPLSVAPLAGAAVPASSEAARTSTPPAGNPMDLEEEMREADRLHEQQHEAALQRHRDEPRDPRWASNTEKKLEAELDSVAAAAKFKVVRVDCRTTTCVSVLEWRTYAEAIRYYGATLRHAYTVNCAQQVLLLPPSNRAAPYQASMIFDCESWRAAGN